MLLIYCLAILMIALSSAPTASGQAPNGTVPALVEWTDPTEHAFTVKVPQAWKILEDQWRYQVARSDYATRLCDSGESGRQNPRVSG